MWPGYLKTQAWFPPLPDDFPGRGGVDTPAARSVNGTTCAGQQPSDREQDVWGAGVGKWTDRGH